MDMVGQAFSCLGEHQGVRPNSSGGEEIHLEACSLNYEGSWDHEEQQQHCCHFHDFCWQSALFPFDRYVTWPLLGGHLFHSRETQTLLDPNSKGSTHIVTKFMDYTGVRKCDIIHENDAYQCLPCNLVWMHVKMRSTLEGIQGSRSIHDLSSFYGIRPQILLLFWNNSAKWGVILSLFSFQLHVNTIGIQWQELGQIAGLSENRLWGTPPQKINKSRPDAKRQKMHF